VAQTLMVVSLPRGGAHGSPASVRSDIRTATVSVFAQTKAF
jgi:hypothetical protein